MTAGLLLINKGAGSPSFRLVSQLRKRFNIQKVGHSGTLDPFATGLMVMLVGKQYTRLSSLFLNHDKEYIATLHLGVSTDSYDCDGTITQTSESIPSLEQIKEALKAFQGQVYQTPPMFSAKKIGGQRLYKLARQGKEVERQPVLVELNTVLLNYQYPHLEISVHCSKGTYIRSIAHDLGQMLGCGAHLSSLCRTRSGPFSLEKAVDAEVILKDDFPLHTHLLTWEHEST